MHLFYHFHFRWADTVESPDSSGVKKEFKHPFVQACAMFLGEFLCLITFKLVYYSLRRRNVSNDNFKMISKETEKKP